MKKIEKLFTVVGFIFIIYLFISFIDVNLHNEITKNGDFWEYNFFKIFF